MPLSNAFLHSLSDEAEDFVLDKIEAHIAGKRQPDQDRNDMTTAEIQARRSVAYGIMTVIQDFLIPKNSIKQVACPQHDRSWFFRDRKDRAGRGYVRVCTTDDINYVAWWPDGRTETYPAQFDYGLSHPDITDLHFNLPGLERLYLSDVLALVLADGDLQNEHSASYTLRRHEHDNCLPSCPHCPEEAEEPEE